MTGSAQTRPTRGVRWLLAAVAVGLALYFFPLFHVVSLAGPPRIAPAVSTENFDAAVSAEKFWREQLVPAATRAGPASAVIAALRRDPAAARLLAHQAGLGGTAHFFVRGTARVVARERNSLLVTLDAVDGELVALRFGPLFGNAVRDGTGLLDVNAFPGVQEFNALSAALNRLVESRVHPVLRERAIVGARLDFVGIAEAPETAAVAGQPLLVFVPVQVEIH